jgi:hypothetical protein
VLRGQEIFTGKITHLKLRFPTANLIFYVIGTSAKILLNEPLLVVWHQKLTSLKRADYFCGESDIH